MALAITDDHAAQEAVFYEVPDWQRNPQALREHLTAREIDSQLDPLARFVGVEAYETAGGVVRRDLFSDDAQQAYLADAELLDRLARRSSACTAEEPASRSAAVTAVHLVHHPSLRPAHAIRRTGPDRAGFPRTRP